MRKIGSKKSCMIIIRNVRHHWRFFVIIKPLLVLLTTLFNMIELNVLRLIGISSTKDLTVGAYALCTSLRVNRLLILWPRSLSDQTSTFVLVSWVSLIFTSQLEEEVRISRLRPYSIYGKIMGIFFLIPKCFPFIIPLCILFILPHCTYCKLIRK